MLGARSVSERQSPKATTNGAIDAPLSRRAARLRFALQLALLLTLPMAACTQPATNNEPENKEVKEHRDQWRPREAQSDFLDIGKQAGIEWLSFVPQDQLDYPEYFEGLDRDQKRRLRLAPKGSDEQVLIQFDLPEGSKLWPVDWYGTELMAIDLPSGASMSLALAKDDGPSRLEDLATTRVDHPREDQFDDGSGGVRTLRKDNDVITLMAPANGGSREAYGERTIVGRTGSWRVYVESLGGGRFVEDVRTVLDSVSIKREIALEGSPKHKCTSTIDEQLAGTLRFPNGTLNLPVTDEMLVRKIGGDSTIQIDGQGAEPWILIRRLDANAAEGDMRATLRKDTTFNRRLKVTSGKWSAGYVPEGAKLPIVCFDYDDTAAENNLLGILKAGDELLTFEVVTRGITDGVIRRAAKEAAIKLLAGATGDPGTEAPEFEPLIGWNMGTMGQGD